MEMYKKNQTYQLLRYTCFHASILNFNQKEEESVYIIKNMSYIYIAFEQSGFMCNKENGKGMGGWGWKE